MLCVCERKKEGALLDRQEVKTGTLALEGFGPYSDKVWKKYCLSESPLETHGGIRISSVLWFPVWAS